MHKGMRWQFSLTATVWITFWLYFDRNGDAVQSICAAVFHECAHLLVLLCLRDVPQKLRFGVCGIRLERAKTVRLSYGQELLIAAAGPAANLLLAAVLLPLCRSAPRLRHGVRVNLMLAFLNLLPIRPLDGGEMLFALLCRSRLPAQADRLCKKIAACTGIPSAAIGIWCFFTGRQNYSLLLWASYVLLLFTSSTSI